MAVRKCNECGQEGKNTMRADDLGIKSICPACVVYKVRQEHRLYVEHSIETLHVDCIACGFLYEAPGEGRILVDEMRQLELDHQSNIRKTVFGARSQSNTHLRLVRPGEQAVDLGVHPR